MINHSEIYDVLFKLAQTVEKTANAQMAAAIFKRNKLVSFGVNSKKTHPFQKRFGKNDDCIFLHSEIDAIKNALRYISLDDLKKCSIYISRIKKDKPKGKYISGMAKPCEGCARALFSFGIKKVYYTEDNKKGFVCL